MESMESLGAQIARTQTPAFKITYGKHISASNWKIWGMASQLISETVVGMMRLYDEVKAGQPPKQQTISEYAESIRAGAKGETPPRENDKSRKPDLLEAARTPAKPAQDADEDFADVVDEIKKGGY